MNKIGFKDIVDIMFYNKRNYVELSDIDKQSMFFIFNRYMAKKYPKQAQFFNNHTMDKATCMDIWFQFLQKETRVPHWFWKGPTKVKTPKIPDYQLLQEFHNLSIKDIYLLYELYPTELKQEIKRLLLITKQK